MIHSGAIGLNEPAVTSIASPAPRPRAKMLVDNAPSSSARPAIDNAVVNEMGQGNSDPLAPGSCISSIVTFVISIVARAQDFE